VREILIYGIAALGSLFILGYSIHMFVGGLVSREIEAALIVGGCTAGAVAIGFMAWDVVKRRRRSAKPN